MRRTALAGLGRDMEKLKKYFSLYWQFLKIGCFTFGGGLNIVSQIQRKYADQYGLLTEEDIVDNYCVGKSLPGTMVANVSYLVGYQLCGIGGGVACVMGLVTAPFIILVLIALFYDSIKDKPYVSKMMYGVRAAVVPIILCALLRMLKASFPDKASIPLAVVAFLLFYFLNWNSLLIIVLGGLCGVLMCRPRSHKGGREQ